MNEDNKTPLFAESVVEIIRRRRSVRTYSKLPIPADVKKKMQSLAFKKREDHLIQTHFVTLQPCRA